MNTQATGPKKATRRPPAKKKPEEAKVEEAKVEEAKVEEAKVDEVLAQPDEAEAPKVDESAVEEKPQEKVPEELLAKQDEDDLAELEKAKKDKKPKASTKTMEVTYEGKTFPSKAALAASLGVNPSNIRRPMRAGKTLEEAVQLALEADARAKKRLNDVDGIEEPGSKE